MSVHVGYTVTDSTVPHGGSGTPTVRLTQSYTPTKPLQIKLRVVRGMTEKRCGGPVYAIDMTVSPDRMGFWVGPDLMRQHQVAPDLTHNPLVQADRRG